MLQMAPVWLLALFQQFRGFFSKGLLVIWGWLKWRGSWWQEDWGGRRRERRENEEWKGGERGEARTR